MKKVEQMIINATCTGLWNEAMNELETGFFEHCGRLNHCNATVFETEHFFILRSYETFIACIHKGSDTCVDMLRSVYGYTATSAKHISKFRKSPAYGGYGRGKWGCENVLTYREV